MSVGQRWPNVKGESRMSALQCELVDDVCQVTLPRLLDIPVAAELKEAILEMLVPEMAVNIRSDAVEQVTTPGIQALMAVAAYAQNQKSALTLTKPTDALIDGFNDLGLFSQLMAWNIE